MEDQNISSVVFDTGNNSRSTSIGYGNLVLLHMF